MLSITKSHPLGKKLFFAIILFLCTTLSAAWNNEQKLTASDGAENDHFDLTPKNWTDYNVSQELYQRG